MSGQYVASWVKELVENQHIADGRIFILEPVDSVSTSTDAVISKISIKQP